MRARVLGFRNSVRTARSIMNRRQLWEGCWSKGMSGGGPQLYACLKAELKGGHQAGSGEWQCAENNGEAGVEKERGEGAG